MKLKIYTCRKCGYTGTKKKTSGCPNCGYEFWNYGQPKKKPEDSMIKRSITLKDKAQNDKLTELGGSKWIRLQIDKS